MKRVALLAVLVLAGCGIRSEPDAVLDCPFPLAWNEVEYEIGVDLPKGWTVGPVLGPGVVLGCGTDELGYYLDEAVSVRQVEDIDPEIAVAARTKESARSTIWVAPGYLIESSRHPLHEALAGNWSYADPPSYTCEEETLRTRGRSFTTPQQGQGLAVVAVSPAVEELLAASSGDRHVAVVPETVFIGFDRNGAPYVAEGDEFMLVVKVCSDEDDPVPSGPFLVAESVRKI